VKHLKAQILTRLSVAPSILFLLLTPNSIFGQGTILFNNLDPSNGKVLVSTGPGAQTLLDRDLNFSLHVEVPRAGPVVFERSWLLADGTAKGINVRPGVFDDPSHSVIVLPGISPGEAAIVIIEAWAGEHPTFFAALNAGALAGGTALSMFTGSVEAPKV
jgi:hypothetical protein